MAKIDPKALEKAVAAEVKKAEQKLNEALAKAAKGASNRSTAQVRATVRDAGKRAGLDLDSKTVNKLADEMKGDGSK